MRTFFVTGTSTGVGKTWVTRGLARAAITAKRKVVAIKPIETGVAPRAEDATALAKACRRPELADHQGFHRARLPVAPYAAELSGESACPTPVALGSTVREVAREAELLLVEGAGGLLVPLDRDHVVADLARVLDADLVLVAANRLGCMSDVLAYVECAKSRRLRIAAVVLTQPAGNDPSTQTNAQILRERLGAAVFEVGRCADDDDRLAEAVLASGLPQALDAAPIVSL